MRLVLSLVLSLIALPAWAAELTMFKDPNCGCCQGWADYMHGQGWQTHVIASGEMDVIKQRYHVPERLQSCHTAVIDGYVIEGHVPAEAIAKLLHDRPKAVGLAAPGMPQGSPGMSGAKEPFTVYLFGDGEMRPYMRF